MNIAKTWTWAAVGFFSNYFQSYEVDQEFTVDRDMMHTPKVGDIIRVIEFNGKAFRNRQDGSKGAEEFATGREMVLECLGKQANKISDQWGVPMVTSYGPATFKILSKTVSDSFDASKLYE